MDSGSSESESSESLDLGGNELRTTVKALYNRLHPHLSETDKDVVKQLKWLANNHALGSEENEYFSLITHKLNCVSERLLRNPPISETWQPQIQPISEIEKATERIVRTNAKYERMSTQQQQEKYVDLLLSVTNNQNDVNSSSKIEMSDEKETTQHPQTLFPILVHQPVTNQTTPDSTQYPQHVPSQTLGQGPSNPTQYPHFIFQTPTHQPMQDQIISADPPNVWLQHHDIIGAPMYQLVQGEIPLEHPMSVPIIAHTRTRYISNTRLFLTYGMQIVEQEYIEWIKTISNKKGVGVNSVTIVYDTSRGLSYVLVVWEKIFKSSKATILTFKGITPEARCIKNNRQMDQFRTYMGNIYEMSVKSSASVQRK